MMPKDKLTRSIGSATVRGSALTIGTQWGARIIGLGSTVILARVLTPADFGIFALALTVPVILSALTGVSVLDYLQRADLLDTEKLNTAFTISFARGILLSLLVLLAAATAEFVQADPRLPPVLCGFALSPLIESFSNPRSVEYARALDFGSLAQRQIFTKLAGAMASVIGAIILRSYWALVIGSLVRSIAWLTITYVGKPYRPRFSLADWRDALAFSIWLTFHSMIDVLGKQADRLIVADWAGLVAVGNFAVAKDFAWMTAAELFDTAQNVLFPAFGNFRHRPKELQANVVETYAFLVALALPWTIGAALVGPQVMILIYGINWGPASEMVTPLAISLAFQSTETVATALVLAVGNPRSLTMRTAITTTLRLTLLIIGLVFFDIQTAVWLLVPASIVSAAINLALLRTLTCLTLAVFASSAWRSWVSAGLMTAAVLGVARLIPPANNSVLLLTDLTAKVAVGAVSYVVAHLLLWYLVGLPHGPEARMLKIVSGRWYRSV
jgi:lipopolysaccharide exporter